MADEEDKKDDDSQNAFNPEGEAVGYLSLDQARVLAIQHARDNTDFYGRGYRRKELAWQVVSSEEGEDHHDIRLSFRPVHGFTGEPGVEHFLIDKAGPIRLRQILVEPKRRPRPALLVVSGGLLVLLAGATVAVAIVSSAALEPEPVPTPSPPPRRVRHLIGTGFGGQIDFPGRRRNCGRGYWGCDAERGAALPTPVYRTAADAAAWILWSSDGLRSICRRGVVLHIQ